MFVAIAGSLYRRGVPTFKIPNYCSIPIMKVHRHDCCHKMCVITCRVLLSARRTTSAIFMRLHRPVSCLAEPISTIFDAPPFPHQLSGLTKQLNERFTPWYTFTAHRTQPNKATPARSGVINGGDRQDGKSPPD